MLPFNGNFYRCVFLRILIEMGRIDFFRIGHGRKNLKSTEVKSALRP